MENMMKRAISAFMALVLVLGMLPGVPMFAGAEEVETQPETVAVETTEAVTVPEETEAPETTAAAETEAPETIPETTVVEETVPEETVPETTAAQETVPEETESEETIPEETVPEEAIPEETVDETIPEVSEEAANAGDIQVVPTGIEISADKVRAYVGDDVKLSAVFTPADVTDTQVQWVVDGGAYLEEGLAKDILRATEAGKFTVKATKTVTASDGEETVLESEPITVEFVDYWLAINEKPIPEENISDKTEYYILQRGASMPISVKYMSQGVEDAEAKVEKEGALSVPALTWSMKVMKPVAIDEETGYATELEETDEDPALYITRKDNPSDKKESVFTAGLVTEYRYIQVTATDNIAGTSNSVTICLYPNSYKLYITDKDGNDITNGTIKLDTADPSVELTQLLTAKIWPIEGDEDLVWSCSDTLVKLEDLDGDLTANKTMNFTADKRTGKTVITIKGVENKDLSATVTIERVRLTQAIELSSESVKITELMAGKSATFKAVEKTAARDYVDNKLLKWELAKGDEAYATLSDKGVLKAKNVSEGRVVTVRCSVIGKEEACIEHLVIIRPKATAVQILAGVFAEDNSPRSLAPEAILNGQTITVNSTGYTPRKLDFVVANYLEEPSFAGDPVGAKQEVTWKSSNTSVAKIDPVTDAIVWQGKNGTTTITATAADGSGKSAWVKLTFGTKLESLWFQDQEGMFLRSGEAWTFTLGFYPENATNKAVNWAVYAMDEDTGEYTASASAIATINSNGRLSAKTVYDNHVVRVVASSKEDPEIQNEFFVQISPKNSSILTLLDGDTCVTKTTIMLDVGESVSLDAVFVGRDMGEYEYAGATWKSSNKNVAPVEEGFVSAEKTGSATITATAQDGQKATVTIKVVSRVDEIEIYEKNDIHVLAAGKSLSLKAIVKDYDTETEKKPNGTPTVSKVSWHIAEGFEDCATVNASGKVTAAKNFTGTPVTIAVYAMSTDGGEVESNYYEITISPAVETIRIDMVGSSETTGSYTHYLLNPGEEYILLNAVTLPKNAADDVTWSTSSKSIATVEEVYDEETEAAYGMVVFHKAGSVTITATAKDGTGKKATFKIKVVRKGAGMLYFDNAKNVVYDEYAGCNVFAIAGGKTLTIKPVMYDTDGKKINVTFGWDIELLSPDYGTAFVKKFNKGVVTTAKVTEAKYAKVTVKVPVEYVGWEPGEVDEEGYVHCDIMVAIYPATTSLQITDNNGWIITSTLWRDRKIDDQKTIELDVQTNTGAASGWTWKSSNEKLATVDQNGVVTYNEEYDKYGTVTITATAKDGTGKSDSIKIYFPK